MPVHNTEIADMFDQLADMLEIEGANPFRVRAYRNASRMLRSYSYNMEEMVKQEKDLTELPYIGEDLAQKIQTIVETGKLPALDKARKRTPEVLSDLMKIEGLGPKRVHALYKELNIRSPKDLEQAARQGRIHKLDGFGKKTETMILERIGQIADKQQRLKRSDAEDFAEPLVDYLADVPGVKRVTIAGSYRRRKETVGDLDILVTARKDAHVMDRFISYDEVTQVISQGQTRSTVHLRSGLQVDLRVVPEVSFGAALHYFTGSKAHNIAVRRMATSRGLKINEYGVFKGEERVAGRTEEEVYKQVDLPYIEPELRENRGEIEAAQKNKLPRLLTLDTIRGDLHCHTKATDGHNSLKEMAQAAQERGYDYLAITDHSRHLTVANGLTPERLAKQIDEIDRLNDSWKDFVILKSCEVDILADGKLDLPDSILERLDLTVCSVHYNFDLSRDKQTERILRAMDNPNFSILAHPSGRLINERAAYEVDLERIMQAAAKNGCCLEVNAQPDRLDLTDEACHMAKEMDVKIAISSDAHSIDNLAFMRFGVDQARRGWLEASDVINTRSLQDLRKLLRHR